VWLDGESWLGNDFVLRPERIEKGYGHGATMTTLGGCRKSRSLVIAAAMSIMAIGCAGESQKTMPLTTRSEKAREYYLTGCDYALRFRRSDAGHYFEMSLKEDPDFAVAHMYLGLVQPNARELSEHLREAKALSTGISEGERLLIDGTIATTNADPVGAIEAFSKLVELYPHDKIARMTLGFSLYQQQDFHGAVEQFEAAQKIDPELAAAYNMLGYSYRDLGDLPQAEAALRKYMEKVPDDPNPADSYAELLLRLGRFDSSMTYYKKAIQIDSQFSASYAGLATNLMLLGRHDEARQVTQALIDCAEHPTYARDARLMNAITFVDQGEFDLALAEMRLRLELSEKMADYQNQVNDLFAIGTILLAAGKPTDASATFLEAYRTARKFDLSPDLLDAYELRYLSGSALAAINRKDLATAEARYDTYREKVVASAGTQTARQLHLLAGGIALVKQDYELAAAEFAGADQQRPMVLFMQAEALRLGGNLEAAKEMYLRAANLNPTTSLEFACFRRLAQAQADSL
jgi:tetratricopeptide (TPR) repeat protein